jgi:hypothetical protein
MVGARVVPSVCLAVVLGGAVGRAAPPPPAVARPLVMRVESELFADGKEPVARSLTLFRDGVAWDFLELPEAGKRRVGAAMRLVEIALHDPARERVVVIDPERHVKTQIEAIRLERLSVSLAKWARGSDDRLVRWAGGPDFADGVTETDDSIELCGPRVRYAVAHEAAPSPEAAAAYRKFADSALLLRALVHPGGIPPFPRLALNRRLEAAGAIPAEVTLEVESRLGALGGPAERLTCVHKVHPALLAADAARIEEAEALVAAAEAVDLPAFVAAERGE